MNIEHCGAEETKIINELRKQTTEELTKVDESVMERIMTAQEVYDKAVEEIQLKFEEITATFNSGTWEPRVDELSALCTFFKTYCISPFRHPRDRLYSS